MLFYVFIIKEIVGVWELSSGGLYILIRTKRQVHGLNTRRNKTILKVEGRTYSLVPLHIELNN